MILEEIAGRVLVSGNQLMIPRYTLIERESVLKDLYADNSSATSYFQQIVKYAAIVIQK